MHDPIILERLEIILQHAAVIEERMKKVSDTEYFVSVEDGQILYDSILIRLQAIGENIKKIEKLVPVLLKLYWERMSAKLSVLEISYRIIMS